MSWMSMFWDADKKRSIRPENGATIIPCEHCGKCNLCHGDGGLLLQMPDKRTGEVREFWRPCICVGAPLFTTEEQPFVDHAVEINSRRHTRCQFCMGLEKLPSPDGSRLIPCPECHPEAVDPNEDYHASLMVRQSPSLTAIQYVRASIMSRRSAENQKNASVRSILPEMFPVYPDVLTAWNKAVSGASGASKAISVSGNVLVVACRDQKTYDLCDANHSHLLTRVNSMVAPKDIVSGLRFEVKPEVWTHVSSVFAVWETVAGAFADQTRIADANDGELKVWCRNEDVKRRLEAASESLLSSLSEATGQQWKKLSLRVPRKVAA